MGKKKATGMSKRESFLDRAVIAENKAIMRFNQSMEDDARGTSRGGPGEQQRRGGRDDRAGSGADAGRSAPRTRGPEVSPEEEARLRDAVVTAAGETGLDEAGMHAVAELVAHGGFDRATDAGWQVALGGHPDERGPEEWELLRAAWRAVRLALLEVWVVDHPDAAPILERERKESARAAKVRSRPRRPDGRRPAGRAGGRPAGARRPIPTPPAAVAGAPAEDATDPAPEPEPADVAADPAPEPEPATDPAPEPEPADVAADPQPAEVLEAPTETADQDG